LKAECFFLWQHLLQEATGTGTRAEIEKQEQEFINQTEQDKADSTSFFMLLNTVASILIAHQHLT
jgi:hypothetical protein